MANAADDVILRLENITKIYPGTVALKDVSVTIRRGEVHGIIGRNGAGKSTLVGIISGLQRPSAGRIRLKGETYPFLTPASAAKAGVAIVPQEPEVVGECTVAENMFMPHYMTTAGGAIIHWHRMAERAQAIVDRARIPVDVRLKMNDLAIGRQQIMLILKAPPCRKKTSAFCTTSSGRSGTKAAPFFTFPTPWTSCWKCATA